MKATVKDLRIRTKEIIKAIGRGEEIILTYRGRIAGKIVPISEEVNLKVKRAKDNLFGIWKDNEAVVDVKSYIDGLRGGRFK